MKKKFNSLQVIMVVFTIFMIGKEIFLMNFINGYQVDFFKMISICTLILSISFIYLLAKKEKNLIIPLALTIFLSIPEFILIIQMFNYESINNAILIYDLIVILILISVVVGIIVTCYILINNDKLSNKNILLYFGFYLFIYLLSNFLLKLFYSFEINDVNYLMFLPYNIFNSLKYFMIIYLYRELNKIYILNIIYYIILISKIILSIIVILISGITLITILEFVELIFIIIIYILILFYTFKLLISE